MAKIGQQQLRAFVDGSADGRVRHVPETIVPKVIEAAGAEDASLEQLSMQARRILEQLIALDEQYREFIITHDQSALEALSACTVALNRLARAQSNGLPPASFGRLDDGSLAANVKGSSSRLSSL